MCSSHNTHLLHDTAAPHSDHSTTHHHSSKLPATWTPAILQALYMPTPIHPATHNHTQHYTTCRGALTSQHLHTTAQHPRTRAGSTAWHPSHGPHNTHTTTPLGCQRRGRLLYCKHFTCPHPFTLPHTIIRNITPPAGSKHWLRRTATAVVSCCTAHNTMPTTPATHPSLLTTMLIAARPPPATHTSQHHHT